MRKMCLFALAGILLAGMAVAQTTGDYRSIQNGNWGTVATWQVYSGTAWVAASTAPPAVPPYANVTIQSGDTVVVEASPKRAANLVVQSEALLFTAQASNRYVRLFGDCTNDGTIGTPTDGLGLLCSTSVYISGTGVTDIGRLQVAAANTSISIACPINLHYAGAGLYGINVDNVTYNIESPNGQVTCGPSTYISITTNSALPSNFNATFNVNGNGITLQPGNNFNISVRSGKMSTLNVYSTLVLGDTLYADCDTTTGSETVIVNGNIAYTSTDVMVFDHLYTNNPTGVSFGFPVRVNNILSIGWGDYDNSSGLTLADSSTIIRYYGALGYAPTFEGGVSLRYGENPGGLPLYTAIEVPSDPANPIYDVYFDNPYGVYLNSTIGAFGTVTLDTGIVDAGGNILGCYNQPVRNTGYVINGMLGIMIPAGDNTISYYVGTDNGYSPATLDFKNVTTPNGVGVTCFGETHSEVNNFAETMQRYWEIGYEPSNPVIFDSCSIGFQYLPEDFNEGFLEADDEATMVVGQYSGDEETWTFPEISVRNAGGTDDGGAIQVANLTGFSDFTMGKNQNSLGADETPPYITGTNPADGAVDVALNQALIVAYSEPMDIYSISGHTEPDFSFSLSWNATGDTLTLTPDTMYSPSTYFTVYNDAGTDLAGNSLEGLPFSFSFTTAAVGDTIAPTIEATYPADGAVDVPVNQVIYIAFSEPMNPTSFDGYATPELEADITWSVNFDTLFITPDTALLYNTIYAVTCTSGTDLAGNYIAGLPVTFSFTTVAVGDTIRPYISATYPADGAIDVPVDQVLYIAFSEPIDPATLVGNSVPDFDITPTWNANFDTLFLAPTTAMDFNTLYTLTLTAATDTAGNNLLDLPVSFSFTTTAATGAEGGADAQSYALKLSPAAPNPMTNGWTALRFSLPSSGRVTLDVFNVLGQKVNTLVDGSLGAGNHTVNWNGTDRAGQKLTTGVYIYQLRAMGKTMTKRLTIIR